MGDEGIKGLFRYVRQRKADGGWELLGEEDGTIEVGVAENEVRATPELADSAGLNALDELVASEDDKVGVGGARLTGVVLLGAKGGGLELQALMEKAVLRADFV